MFIYFSRFFLIAETENHRLYDGYHNLTSWSLCYWRIVDDHEDFSVPGRINSGVEKLVDTDWLVVDCWAVFGGVRVWEGKGATLCLFGLKYN